MSHVNVTINGRQYRMACEAGEEQRLQSLAESFDNRIGEIRRRFGEVGDARLTVMAALMIADELRDSQQSVRRLQTEKAALQTEHSGADDRVAQSEAAVAEVLDAATSRIERMMQALSRPSGGGMAIG
jgi:cell division protein ZapA